ncbi:MAG TPA: MCP four helix bundle domain-containing protein, partial [Armatimonadota bacterium]
MLGRLKIGAKLAGGFLLLAILTLVIGINGFGSLGRMGDHIEDIGGNRLPGVDALGDLATAQAAITAAERTLINPFLTDAAQIKSLHARLDASMAQADDAVKRYEALPMYDDEEKTAWKTAKADWDAWRAASSDIQALVLEQDHLAAAGVDAMDPKSLAVGRRAFAASMAARPAYLKSQASLVAVSNINAKRAETGRRAASEDAARSRSLFLIILGAALASAVALAVTLTRSIVKPLRAMTAAAGRIAEGDVDVETRSNSRDETGDLMRAFGVIVESTRQQAAAADSIAAGDLSVRIEARSSKDVLAISMARVAETLRALIAEEKALSEAAVAGRLAVRGDASRFEGGYREIVQGVNDTLDAVIGPVNVAAAIVDRIGKGDIPEKITDDFRGDLNVVKTALNACIDAVNALVTDANMLSQAAVEGRLETRADATKHQGDFRKVVQGVNDTLDAVIGPLNVAAGAIDRIGQGEIPEKIT